MGITIQLSEESSLGTEALIFAVDEECDISHLRTVVRFPQLTFNRVLKHAFGAGFLVLKR